MADTDNPAKSDDAQGKPPWGDDFDAERAWRLVQNLRAEVTDLKTERDSIKTERDQLKDSTGSESDKVKAAEDRAAKAEKSLWTERALRKHPELEEFVEFLDGDTEEAVTQKAERLAAIGSKKPADDKDGKDGAKGDDDAKDGKKPDDADGAGSKPDDAPDGLPGKPTPDLKPGHGGESPKPFDPAAVALKAREATY